MQRAVTIAADADADADTADADADTAHLPEPATEAADAAPSRVVSLASKADPTPTRRPQPASPAPLPADHAVQVSIGTIHLRVDAPQAPAVQAAAAPRTAPARAPAPARSGLSRLALRRL
jgi:hypothetical protein